MNAIRAIVSGGRLDVSVPPSWPDGTEVVIQPFELAGTPDERPLMPEATFGIAEDVWEDTPEAIAAWLQWYDSLEPIERTPQEETDWRTYLAERKEREKSTFGERAEHLRRMWE